MSVVEPVCDRPASADGRAVVYYDGTCPLCRREIAHYRKRDTAGRIEWRDIGHMPDGAVAPDLTRTEAMAQLHARRADGRLVRGAEAFALLWSQVPGYRWLGRLAAVAAVSAVLQRAYTAALVVRPHLQRLFR
jgi:predicted DCC family thiol-disulfide oxidoreductase YuxK